MHYWKGYYKRVSGEVLKVGYYGEIAVLWFLHYEWLLLEMQSRVKLMVDRELQLFTPQIKYIVGLSNTELLLPEETCNVEESAPYEKLFIENNLDKK